MNCVQCHMLELVFICCFLYVACSQAVSDQEAVGHKGASEPLHTELVSNEDEQQDKVRI